MMVASFDERKMMVGCTTMMKEHKVAFRIPALQHLSFT